jgi:hypothetical protein
MTRREKLAWLAIGIVYVIGLLSLIPSYHELCEVVEKANNEHCPTYQVVPFALIKIRQLLDSLGVVITALATIAIAAFTYSLRQSTDRLKDSGEKQIAEARRIGEAQVRAYVDIRAVVVIFIDLGIGDVQPLVKITIKNTGQSPAQNFVWNPTVQYLGVGQSGSPLEGELGGNWREIRGVGISVGEERIESAMVTGILLRKFLQESGSNPDVVLVRVRIQFEFDDVFDRKSRMKSISLGAS